MSVKPYCKASLLIGTASLSIYLGSHNYSSIISSSFFENSSELMPVKVSMGFWDISIFYAIYCASLKNVEVDSLILSRESFIGDDKDPCWDEEWSMCFFLILGIVGDFIGQLD